MFSAWLPTGFGTSEQVRTEIGEILPESSYCYLRESCKRPQGLRRQYRNRVRMCNVRLSKYLRILSYRYAQRK